MNSNTPYSIISKPSSSSSQNLMPSDSQSTMHRETSSPSFTPDPDTSTEDASIGKRKHSGWRWTPEEDKLLLQLCDESDASYDDIADKLERSPDAIELRYAKIKAYKQMPDNWTWTPEHDSKIIEGRRRSLNMEGVAEALQIPTFVVRERSRKLQKDGKIPNKYTKATWSEEEDEILMRLYMACADDEEICELNVLPKKTLGAIRKRRVFHCNGGGGGSRPTDLHNKLMIAFGDAEWSKQSVVDGKYTLGE